MISAIGVQANSKKEGRVSVASGTWVSSSMITLFSGLIHGVGLYILVVSSVFFWHSTARPDELRKQDK